LSGLVGGVHKATFGRVELNGLAFLSQQRILIACIAWLSRIGS
jgi:hypothetical protein